MRRPDTFTLLGGLLILAAAGTYVASYLGGRGAAPDAPAEPPLQQPARQGFDPLSPAAHWALAERLEKAGQTAEAERVRRAARRLGGETVPEPSPASHGTTGGGEMLELPAVEGAEALAAAMAIASKGDLDGALEAIRKLIDTDGENHLNQTALGYILSYRAEPAEAEKALSRALEIEKDYAPAVFGRGVVRLRGRRYTVAVPDLQKACRSAPEMLPWRMELAKAHLGASQPDEALKQLEFVLRKRPATPEIYRMVGDCLLRGGREAEARRWYRSAILLGGPEAFPGLRQFAEGVNEGS